jgi:3-hydroxyisobutyrate dehydrogenase
LSNLGARLIDAPVSGGVRRAVDATMTMMTSGDPDAIEECVPIFNAISAKRSVLRPEPGDAAAYRSRNNQLAAVNFAIRRRSDDRRARLQP